MLTLNSGTLSAATLIVQTMECSYIAIRGVHGTMLLYHSMIASMSGVSLLDFRTFLVCLNDICSVCIYNTWKITLYTQTVLVTVLYG